VNADDRVAISEGANINDRSQQGDRDSELTGIVRDDAPINVKLNGVTEDPASANVNL
jgi:phospholipase D1/2